MSFCIYKTTNLINGKTYIGQTINEGKSLDKYLGSGTALKRAVKKYGRPSFEKEILFNCSGLEQMNRLERLSIRMFCPDYNIDSGGRGVHINKGKILSQDHRDKIAAAHQGKRHATHITTEEHKRKISESLTGRHLSAETKLKLAQVNIGKKVSEETRAKMSTAQKRRYA